MTKDRNVRDIKASISTTANINGIPPEINNTTRPIVPLHFLSSIWVVLCASLVAKRTELSLVFFSFLGSFAVAYMLSCGRCHPCFPSSDEAESKKESSSSLPHPSERINATTTKTIVGLVACMSSFLLLLSGGDTNDKENYKSVIEFQVLAILTGYLAFNLWYAPFCRPLPSIFSIWEDVLTLSSFLICLVRHTDNLYYPGNKISSSDLFGDAELFRLSQYHVPILVWILYKSIRLVLSLVTCQSHHNTGEIQGRLYDRANGKEKELNKSINAGKKPEKDTVTYQKLKENSTSVSKDSTRDVNDDKKTLYHQTDEKKKRKKANDITHQSINHSWTIHGVSYDLNDFVHRHPGGKEAIELGRGRDCTALFESYHPFTQKHKLILQKYRSKPYIISTGIKTIKHEVDTLPIDPFYETLKERAMIALKENGIDPIRHRCATYTRLTYYLSIFMCLVLSGTFHIKGSPIGSFFFAVFGWLIGSLGHDGGHYSVSRIPLLNDISLWGMSLLCNPIMWQHQHTYAHHSHTNDFDHDPDLHHFSSFIKVHRRFKERNTMYSLQIYRLYVFWVYTFVVFGTCLWIPFSMISNGSLHGIVEWTDRKRPLRVLAMIFHLVTYLVIIVSGPFVFSEQSRIVCSLCVILHLTTSGLLFAIFSQINHLNEPCLDEKPMAQQQSSNKISPFPATNSWAAKQIHTSNNFATQSRLWHILSNGLNLQIEHHLFPGLNHCHLHIVAPAVKKTCEEYGVRYKSYETWSGVMEATLQWLEKLSPHN